MPGAKVLLWGPLLWCCQENRGFGGGVALFSSYLFVVTQSLTLVCVYILSSCPVLCTFMTDTCPRRTSLLCVVVVCISGFSDTRLGCIVLLPWGRLGRGRTHGTCRGGGRHHIVPLGMSSRSVLSSSLFVLLCSCLQHMYSQVYASTLRVT